MTIITTYTNARSHLSSFMDRAVEDRETILITRRGSEDVALIAADELRSLLETAHLLRSPRNADRLLESIRQAEQGQGRKLSVEQLRAELGLNVRAMRTPRARRREGRGQAPGGEMDFGPTGTP